MSVCSSTPLITLLLPPCSQAHDTYYVLGDAANLRDSAARVLPQWEPGMPAYTRVCAMLAFGYAENCQYDRAEETAMSALDSDPSDAWRCTPRCTCTTTPAGSMRASGC